MTKKQQYHKDKLAVKRTFGRDIIESYKEYGKRSKRTKI